MGIIIELVHILPGSVKTIITTLPGCVKNNWKYFPDVPVEGDMNEVEAGVSRECGQAMRINELYWSGLNHVIVQDDVQELQ